MDRSDQIFKAVASEIETAIAHADSKDDTVCVYSTFSYWGMHTNEYLAVRTYCSEDVGEDGEWSPLGDDEPTIVLWHCDIPKAQQCWDWSGRAYVDGWLGEPEMKPHRCAEWCGNTGSRYMLHDPDPEVGNLWFCSVDCVREHLSEYSDDELLHLACKNEEPVKRIIYDYLAEQV